MRRWGLGNIGVIKWLILVGLDEDVDIFVGVKLGENKPARTVFFAFIGLLQLSAFRLLSSSTSSRQSTIYQSSIAFLSLIIQDNTSSKSHFYLSSIIIRRTSARIVFRIKAEGKNGLDH